MIYDRFVIFAMSCAGWQSEWLNVARDMCKQKGVPYALVLTFVNFATSTACQKQSNGNAPLDVYIHILNVWAMAQCFLCQAYGIVIYVSVGLSTLLVSTGRAMRRPTNVERVIGLAPRFFCALRWNSNTRNQHNFMYWFLTNQILIICQTFSKRLTKSCVN